MSFLLTATSNSIFLLVGASPTKKNYYPICMLWMPIKFRSVGHQPIDESNRNIVISTEAQRNGEICYC